MSELCKACGHDPGHSKEALCTAQVTWQLEPGINGRVDNKPLHLVCCCDGRSGPRLLHLSPESASHFRLVKRA